MNPNQYVLTLNVDPLLGLILDFCNILGIYTYSVFMKKWSYRWLYTTTNASTNSFFTHEEVSDLRLVLLIARIVARVDVQQVLEYGAVAKEALLLRADPWV